MRRGSRHGIDLFIEDGAYTTVASAVSILVVLALLFSATGAVWTLSRSGDAQVAADATSLAGANVVCSYHTLATVLDATVLSLGLTGFAVAGAGLVGLLVPGANAAAAEALDTGIDIIRARNELAESASRGLERVEYALPYLVAANGMRACGAQSGESASYSGIAVAIPRDSASEFPALEGDGIDVSGLEEAGDALDEAADELARAHEETSAAKEAAWLADCGREGRCMQERADALAGLPAQENPDYASSITWEPSVALDRTRAYYRARLASNAPEGSGIEAAADAAARDAFYRFAVREFAGARAEEGGGRFVADVPLLPRNTDEMRGTDLYTEAIWPSSMEGSGLTLHYSSSCPGATGAAGPTLPISATETGRARECAVCRFGPGDLGRVAAASTSIDNGYEYHLREFTLALGDYASCRNRELELERATRAQAGEASDAFGDALQSLEGPRPRIAPPGREGVVSVVVSGEGIAPEELATRFSGAPSLPGRGAISAAVAAPDSSADAGNVLSEFFSGVEERSGGSAAIGFIDDAMDVWGSLLTGYGDASGALGGVLDDMLGGLRSLGLGPIAEWLADGVEGTVRALGIEPVDLSLRKPVLTDTSDVLSRPGAGALADVQDLLRSISAEATDPAAALEALGYGAVERLSEVEVTVAELPLPGGGSFPVTVRLGDLARAASAGAGAAP